MNDIKIYGIKPIDNDDIFYVGSTRLTLNKRLGQHKYYVKKRAKNKSQIMKFLEIGLENIEIILLQDEISEFERLKYETIWYDLLILSGHNLINAIRPNETPFDYVKYKETRHKEKLIESDIKWIFKHKKLSRKLIANILIDKEFMNIEEIAEKYNTSYLSINKILYSDEYKEIFKDLGITKWYNISVGCYQTEYEVYPELVKLIDIANGKNPSWDD